MWRASLAAAVDAIIVSCDDGIIRAFSQGAQQLFGYTSEEIVGTNLARLMPSAVASEHADYVKRYLTGQGAHVVGHVREVAAKRKSGKVFPMSMSLGEFHVDGKRMFIAVARESGSNDVRQVSQQLNLAHQSALLHELIRGISDKINQPLTALAAYADVTRRLAEQQSSAPEPLVETLEKMSAQVLRTSEALSSMRNMTSSYPQKRGLALVKNVFSELSELLISDPLAQRCTMLWRFDPDLPSIKANHIQLQQVLLLLIRNSLEAFPTVADSDARVTVSATETENGRIQFCVEDNGLGFDEQCVDTMYHPFESTKHNRLGIGLAICTTTIFYYGGRLWHEQPEGGGSRMIFDLPVFS